MPIHGILPIAAILDLLARNTKRHSIKSWESRRPEDVQVKQEGMRVTGAL